MRIKDIKNAINSMNWYSNVLDKMSNQDWWADLDAESAQVLMDLSEELIEDALFLQFLLDEYRLEV